MIENIARKAEAENNWREAQRLWASIGRKQDADACKLIADSVEQGDYFRGRVAQELGEMPSAELSPHKYIKWHEGLSRIHREIFSYEKN